MRRLFTIVLLSCLLGCIDKIDTGLSNRNNAIKTSTEYKLSLNGVWKFNTFFGDGSSYRDIEPQESDIVIDNSDADLVEVNGSWEISTESGRESQQWGKDYLTYWFEKLDPSINVKFYYPAIKAGFYEHFVYYPFGMSLHSTFTVKYAEGEVKHYISQRNRPGQWISLGTFKLDPDQKPHIEVNTYRKSQVTADAVMLRPVSEQKYLQAVQQKKAAPLANTADDSWHDLKVPGHWGMINRYSTYTGKGWYRKTFQLPNDWQVNSDEKLRLQFDGVYHIANVYLNGHFIGRHQGGFTPFEFDVSDKINHRGNNLLAVEADNSAIVGATWNWGGIIRDVTLVKNQNVRIKYQYIHAEPDLKIGTAALTLKVRVENSSDLARTLDFEAQITKQQKLANLDHKLDVAANSTTEFEIHTVLSSQQVQFWHFDTPHLYQLKSQISEKGISLHTKQDRFGIRKVELTESQMLLNGEPVRIGGYNRISDHRYWGSSEPYELLVKDVDMMKDAGANFMRIMHGTQNKKLIELCDEKGILIFEEANIRELTNPEFVAPEYKVNKQWIREMIERDINHPSIIGWSIGNELSDHYEYVEKIIKYVKTELDPYRLVTGVSNTGYRKQDTAENDPLGLSEFIMQNIYQDDPEKVVTTITERWPNRPLFISEYGLGRFGNASLDNDYPNFSTWHAMLRGRNTHVVGTSLWSYNDYRSGYAQTLEEENRAWGIVNNWRQKRRGYQTFQKGLSPIKDMQLSRVDQVTGKATLKFTVRDLTDYPSYTMRDYKLQWQLRDISGQVLEEHSLVLPTLTPDYGIWQKQISWAGGNDIIHDLNVKVLSTNGYVRYEKTQAFSVPAQPQIKGVISADKALRVVFDRHFSGDEHFVRYRDRAGNQVKTIKTINSHIDLTELNPKQIYQLELIASNTIGDSSPSKTVSVKPQGVKLPPVIWHDMIRDNRLIVGYSGEKQDKTYELRYGYQADKLDLTATTSSRGVLIADIHPDEKTVFYQLKRITQSGESTWSLLRSSLLGSSLLMSKGKD